MSLLNTTIHAITFLTNTIWSLFLITGMSPYQKNLSPSTQHLTDCVSSTHDSGSRPIRPGSACARRIAASRGYSEVGGDTRTDPGNSVPEQGVEVGHEWALGPGWLSRCSLR